MKIIKSWTFTLAVFFILVGSAFGTSEEALKFGRFGTVTIYRETPRPSHVVLFVSGDGGWNLGVIDMAKSLSSLDALVAGIDITHYYKELAASPDKCSYPAADFESLSQFIQKKYDFPSYVQPVLVGYSSGATLVYAVLAQSPPNTFQGAVSLGFCPDLSLTKPLCKGNGLEWQPGPKGKGYSFLPAKNLSAPWVAFQGTIDQVCDASMVEVYVKQVASGEIVLLPKVGHGFSIQRNWMPEFRKTFTDLVKSKKPEQTAYADELKDLPLVEVPAKKTGVDTMAVIVSGDGGWAGIDREIAAIFSMEGVAVAGLNSLQYFWNSRTPAEASRDLERILKHYLPAWNKKRVILIGYSIGADVLPFMINGLSRETAKKVSLAVLVGPDQKAAFEFHITYWLGGSPPEKSVYPVLPEVKKIKDMRVLCLYGESEKDPLCRELDPNSVTVVPLKGGHHFGGDYRSIAEIILKKAR